jgi:NodT family efflux transporter outer membrane factor (OMF) lipoprotein
LLLLNACAARTTRFTPPVSPQMAEAKQWNTPLAGGATAKAANDETLSRWWATLGDPVLTALEERAVKGNLDLRKAEAAIRQARAQRDAARADRLPSFTASGSASGGRSSNWMGGQTSQSYGASVDASWEPDFYGKIRRNIEAYNADIEVAQEDLRNTLVSLTAEVAINYIDVRSYQSQIAVTRANLISQQETYELTLAQYQSGLATQLDAEQARLNVESTRAAIPTLETSLQKARDNIAILLGERPGSVDQELGESRPIPVVPVEVAVGVPADLLRRRPDIRGAERTIAAQTARLGVAEANLNVTFTLSGSLGLNALKFINVLTPNSLATNFAGSVSQSILNRGKLREQISIQNAVLDRDVVAYESTVLTALQDVENAINAFAKEQVRRKSLAEAEAAAEKAVSMSRDLYAAGLKDFLAVLEAQRSLLTLQNQLAQSDAAITANLIRLYKALGGGWS